MSSSAGACGLQQPPKLKDGTRVTLKSSQCKASSQAVVLASARHRVGVCEAASCVCHNRLNVRAHSEGGNNRNGFLFPAFIITGCVTTQMSWHRTQKCTTVQKGFVFCGGLELDPQRRAQTRVFYLGPMKCVVTLALLFTSFRHQSTVFLRRSGAKQTGVYFISRLEEFGV